MFTFFDYLFYRTYIVYDKKKDPAMIFSVIFVTASFLYCTVIIWASFFMLLFGTGNKHGAVKIMCVLAYICFYLRYRKKKKGIFERFKYSKYNKKIPSWLIWLSFPMSIILGFAIAWPLRLYLVNNNLQGVLGKWLGIL